MKKSYLAVAVAAAVAMLGFMAPAHATASDAGVQDEFCGFTESEFTRTIHHPAVTGTETEYVRTIEFEETLFQLVEHHPAVYETVTYIEWRARGNLSGNWYGSPVLLPEGEEPSGSAGVARHWAQTGHTEVEDVLVEDAWTEVVDELWSVNSPGSDWTATSETRVNSEEEFAWGVERPAGDGWEATGETRSIILTEAWSEDPEYVWAIDMPEGEGWEPTGETRTVEEECPAVVDDSTEDVQLVAQDGVLPNSGGPSFVIGLVAAMLVVAGGLVLTRRNARV